MNNPLNAGPLSEEEFDRLDDILNINEDRGLTVESVDGFFAALACSPVATEPSEWLPVVWGGEPPEWATIDEAQEAIGLLMRMWDQVADEIQSSDFAPLMTTGLDGAGNEITLPHAWCMGFMEGMQLHEKYWLNESNEELQKLLLPIGIVARDAAVLLGVAPEEQEQLPPAELEQCVELLPELVLELRDYWLEHPAAPSILRSGAANLAANDPCPCGSGKSFKQCHGEAAH
jgi:uncharacterized protein